jgi:hypothetical protein
MTCSNPRSGRAALGVEMAPAPVDAVTVDVERPPGMPRPCALGRAGFIHPQRRQTMGSAIVEPLRSQQATAVGATGEMVSSVR